MKTKKLIVIAVLLYIAGLVGSITLAAHLSKANYRIHTVNITQFIKKA